MEEQKNIFMDSESPSTSEELSFSPTELFQEAIPIPEANVISTTVYTFAQEENPETVAMKVKSRSRSKSKSSKMQADEDGYEKFAAGLKTPSRGRSKARGRKTVSKGRSKARSASRRGRSKSNARGRKSSRGRSKGRK